MSFRVMEMMTLNVNNVVNTFRSELNTHRKNHRDITNEIETLNANLKLLLDEKKVPENENEVSKENDDNEYFICDQCDNKFVTKTSLKNHKKRQHKM